LGQRGGALAQKRSRPAAVAIFDEIRRRHPEEWLEQLVLIFGRNADAVIADADFNRAPEISQSTPAGPPIDRFLATHSYYIAYVVPGGMYADNPDDVPTIGTQAVLIASSNQPDELSYAVVKAVIENFTDFRLLHPALSTLEIKDMVPSEAVMPIHPGALNYYREAGLVH
jgi:TRAP transporter TAXI family solute receptor